MLEDGLTMSLREIDKTNNSVANLNIYNQVTNIRYSQHSGLLRVNCPELPNSLGLAQVRLACEFST